MKPQIKRHVVVEKDIDRNLCIKIEELKALFDYYKPGDPRRIAWMTMSTMGMRPSEVCDGKDIRGEIIGLTVKSILNDFQYLRYRARKPVNQFYKKTQTLITTYKMRTRPILYSTLRHELKVFCLKNYHCMKDGKIFPFTSDMFKRELSKIRKKIISGELKGEVWKGFLDPATQRVWCSNNDSFQQRFRITPYSLRRFYNTFKLWTEHGGNIVLSTRDMGHTKVDTNMIYSYSPDKIGLDERHMNQNVNFDMLFGKRFKHQMPLSEYI